MSKFLRFCFATLVVTAICAVSAMAQSTTTGAINGTVMNPNKEVVVGATVTVKNLGTNKEQTATTDDNGGFKFANLEPGNYSVVVNASGFAAFNAERVVVEVGRATELPVEVSLQGVTGQVQVTAEAPVINTSQQDFSSNVNQTTINESPINGRRWSNFAILTPGAVPDGTFGLISFRGISGLLNNNTVDGGDNNQAFFAEERGRTRIPYIISQASIKEFQVNTSSYSAEYGRSAGGVTNAVTKSGTNEFHGSAFFYDRDNSWGARNPLATNTVLVNGVFTPIGIKPEDTRYQFGGTIGGPIVKDKAFFFFSYDQQRRNFPGLSRFIDPNVLNLSAASRTALLARGLTTAQVDSTLTFLNSLTGQVPRRGDNLIFLPKVDWHITPNNVFTATYNWLKWDSPAGIQTQATNTRARDNFGDDFVRARFLNLRLASTISPTLINEARFQWGQDNEYQFSQPPLPGEPTNSIGGRSPQTFFNNGFTFGIPEFLERVAFPDERRTQFADTITWTSNKHTVKVGADFNHVEDIINNLRFSGAEFNYTGANGLPDFIVDYVNFTTSGAIRALAGGTNGQCVGSARRAGKCYGGNFNQGFGVLGLTLTTNDYNFFIQDDWRVTPQVTVNLGLRYEYQQNPTNDAARINPLLPQTGNRVSDKNNFGPRFGFAWDVKGDGKTSIRGGYGIYFGRLINSTVYNALINTGVGTNVAQRQFTISAANFATVCPPPLTVDNCTLLPIYPNLIPPAAPPVGAVQYFANRFELPRIHQLDAVFEREIARNTVVSASYLFSYGEFLPNFVDTNLNQPTTFLSLPVSGGPSNGAVWRYPLFTGARPAAALGFTQAITEIRSDVVSKYHALVLQFNRRLTNNVQIQSSYTMSRAWDTGQSSITFTANNVPFNAFDQSGEGSLSGFDRRHKFVYSMVYNSSYKNKDNKFAYALLNGWTISPILNWFSGARVTGNISGSPAGTTAGGVNGSGGANRFALLPRNSFKTPSIQYLDIRLSRRFSLGEKAKLEVLGEAFNFFNRTQVTGINSTLYNFTTAAASCPGGIAPCLNFNTPFGQTTAADSTLFRERQVQLAVRFEF